ncbi:hypothetical protein ACW9KT_02465 [Hymenobacter sp. HD11105]|jgi:hypothetical protein
MRKLYPCLFGFALLASCSAVRDDAFSSRSNKKPVDHNTVVECILYDGMTKESNQLTNLGVNTKVQVIDTVDAYFVRARVTENGKVLNGYLYRTCFPQI